jgi:4-hydroxy-L-threonine phosphate dehydrogenase PdxA
MNNKPNIAILLGDPSGVGPELACRLINEDIVKEANIIVIGEKSILEDGENISKTKSNLKTIKNFDEIDFKEGSRFFIDLTNGKNRTYKKKEVCAESGASVLEALEYALDLANSKKIQAINFAPMNKTSLILGGCKFNDEHEFMSHKLGVKEFTCEFNVVDNFWTARVTSHIPLRQVANQITKENILKPMKLIDKTLRMNGFKNPRVAVQALNPHAEFGTEEKDHIIPAIEEAKKLGINAGGPLPCDTSFITAFKNKNYDCIVGMYHDGLQCGLKAFGFDRGVTVSGGLTIPVTTPAHGTAFDITETNTANLEPTINSFKIALQMCKNAPAS